MAYETKDLLVWVKAMSRGQALPLDASEIHASLAEAQAYAATAIAYEGQTVKAKLEDGKYHTYTLQPSDAGYVLEEIGSVSASDMKQYVMVVDALPESGQEEGVLYINTSDCSGSVWTGSAWKQVFWDLTARVDEISDKIDAVEESLTGYAPLENPVFSGVVKVGEEEVALKSYVESLFAQLEETTVPGIVDSSNPLPADYKAGTSYRVAEAGTYAGVVCEVGDLILVVKDYAPDTASDSDFLVIQANIDGAVSSKAETTTVGEIVVFDSVTGKVIGSSGVQIGSLEEAIDKAHEHENKDQLDSFTKTQDEILAEAASAAQALVTAHEEAVNEALENKADKATTLEGYGITDAYNKTEVDSSLKTITDNLNTKVSADEVDTKISEARTEILEAAASDAANALETRIGGIPETDTLKDYIDRTANTGSADVSTAIAEAKAQAIATANTYTDEQIASALTVVEF